MESANCSRENKSLLNAEELSTYRIAAEKSLLQRGGVKDYCPVKGNLEQESKINEFRRKYIELIKQERVDKKDSLGRAEWLDDKKLAKQTKDVGKYLKYFGHNKDKEIYFLPEEILFLVDIGAYELYYKDMLLSLEECFGILLSTEKLSLQKYQVYAYLIRFGFIVRRYQSSDQVQAKRQSNSSKRDANNDESETIKKKQRVDEMENNDMCSESVASTSMNVKYCNWDYSKIDFPDFSKQSVISLPEVDSKYLPGRINMQKREYCFPNGLNSAKYITDVPGCKIIKNTASNWKEFKEVNNCDILEKLQASGCGCLWRGEVQPLLNPAETNTQASILKSIKANGPSRSLDENFTENELILDYDVYSPDGNFRKSAPGRPDLRLIVVKQNDQVPHINNIELLNRKFKANVPVYFAIVSSGDISFVSLITQSLPDLC
ncbi:DgyrCDS5523 [Dimorphilus gyrociliatus]|uniref:DgyrCDS5523 n=1 Tax=Dimorphilus gyrociliatus TaxID=2664684 RepID=A0A7I8VLS4_9ANNE|nr:DgyrCDS5523 [Dimorphilus gyrociliatus]